MESPPPPPLSNTALFSSGRVDQTEITGGSDKPKPKSKHEKWELGGDKTPVVKRSETQSQRRRRLEVETLPLDKPRIDRQMGDSSRSVTPDLNPPEASMTPIGVSFETGPDDFDITGRVGHSTFDIWRGAQSTGTLDVRRIERYSAGRMTTSSISIKSTISEDLSREEKDRGAKLRYLQKRHEGQTLGSYKV